MGIKGEVKKHRYLVLYEQTRIHIDTVEGLGNFMELEVSSLRFRKLGLVSGGSLP